MTPTRLFFISIFLLFLAENGFAATKGFLLLENTRQAVNFSYELSTGHGNGTSSEQNSFAEGYQFLTDYAIYDPHLLRGKFDVELRFDQQVASATNQPTENSRGINFLYNIGALIKDRSPCPVNLYARSELVDVLPPFAPGYQVNASTYGVVGTLQNVFLPSTFQYEHGTSETSGLSNDRTNTNDTFRIQSRNNWGISTTHFSLAALDTSTDFKNGLDSLDRRYYSANIANTLNLGSSRLARSLTTSMQYSEEAEQSSTTKSLTFNESFICELGKALRTGLAYAYTSQDSLRGTYSSHMGDGWIQHQLFQSLTTRLAVRAQKNYYTNGDSSDIAGRASLFYSKILPQDSRLYLSAYQGVGESSRNQGTGILAAPSEQFTVVFTQQIFLAQLNVVQSSIVVRNTDTLARLSPTTDYLVNQQGNRTEIIVAIPGSSVKAGDRLTVDYDYQVSPAVDITTIYRGVGTEVVLFGNKHRFYANWDDTYQDSVSVQVDPLSLNAATTWRAGYEGRFEPYTFKGEYYRLDSYGDKHQYILGGVNYNAQLGRGQLSLYASDSYVWFEPTLIAGISSQPPATNTFFAGGRYNQNVFINGLLTCSLDYLSSSGAATRESLVAGLGLAWRIGRFALALDTQAAFQSLSGKTSDTERVRLKLTRYF